MDVSVIIPTYKRSHTLFQALHSLQEQTLDNFEILVVDNGHDPELEQAVADFNADCRIPVLYLRSPQAGVLHEARHAGVRACRGDLTVFTDDDATFDPCWLQVYRDQFEAREEMAAAGGPVRPVWAEPPPPWLVTYMNTPQWMLDYDPNPGMFAVLSLMERDPPEFCLDAETVFFGVNMAIRKEVFDYSGFHPELYDTRTVGDGESGLVADIAARGGLIGYVPEAVVYHHIPPQRMTVDYLSKYADHLAGAVMFRDWWNRKRTPAALAKGLWQIIREGGRVWITDWFVRHRTDPAALDMRFRARLGRYKLKYWWWMWTDPVIRAALDRARFSPYEFPPGLPASDAPLGHSDAPAERR